MEYLYLSCFGNSFSITGNFIGHIYGVIFEIFALICLLNLNYSDY